MCLCRFVSWSKYFLWPIIFLTQQTSELLKEYTRLTCRMPFALILWPCCSFQIIKQVLDLVSLILYLTFSAAEGRTWDHSEAVFELQCDFASCFSGNYKKNVPFIYSLSRYWWLSQNELLSWTKMVLQCHYPKVATHFCDLICSVSLNCPQCIWQGW